MRLLALDIATKTGWAVFEDGKRIASGVWNLDDDAEKGESADERLGRRAYQMRVCLSDVMSHAPVDCLAYEDVPHHVHRSGGQKRLHGALRGAALAFAYSRECSLVGIHPKTAKLVLAGTGAADKETMIHAAIDTFECEIEDDNEADALAVGLAALEATLQTPRDLLGGAE